MYIFLKCANSALSFDSLHDIAIYFYLLVNDFMISRGRHIQFDVMSHSL